MKIAVLDDYQSVAQGLADWDRLGAEVTFFHDHLHDEAAVAERLHDFEVVGLMRERTPFPRSLFDRLPNLKLLVTTGLRNLAIDMPAAADHGVTVCGTETGASATHELIWALIFATIRRIPEEDRAVRDGRWQVTLGDDLYGKTIGIIGLGRLGKLVAGIARAFGMHPIAWSQHLTPEQAAAAGAEYVEKDELFRRADLVTIHVVLSERTRGLVGARELGLMKPTAYLINTSRGPIVDEAALIATLRERRIAGAGLDVFDVEPLPLDHPLRSMPNTVVTPHVGFASREAYKTYYPQMVEDIAAWAAGKPIRVLTANAPVAH